MYQVYSCIVFFLCVAVVLAKFDESSLPDDMKKLANSFHKTCLSETKVNKADVDKLRLGEFPDNDKISCYVKCVLTEGGAMDKSGEIDVAALAEVIPDEFKDTVKEDFKQCLKKGDGIDDHCEKAYAIVQCVQERDPDNFWFP